MRKPAQVGNLVHMEPTIIPIGEAAARLGVSRRTVHGLLHDGEIIALKLPGQTGAWIITDQALTAYEKKRDNAKATKVAS